MEGSDWNYLSVIQWPCYFQYIKWFLKIPINNFCSLISFFFFFFLVQGRNSRYTVKPSRSEMESTKFPNTFSSQHVRSLPAVTIPTRLVWFLHLIHSWRFTFYGFSHMCTSTHHCSNTETSSALLIILCALPIRSHHTHTSGLFTVSIVCLSHNSI